MINNDWKTKKKRITRVLCIEVLVKSVQWLLIECFRCQGINELQLLSPGFIHRNMFSSMVYTDCVGGLQKCSKMQPLPPSYIRNIISIYFIPFYSSVKFYPALYWTQTIFISPGSENNVQIYVSSAILQTHARTSFGWMPVKVDLQADVKVK